MQLRRPGSATSLSSSTTPIWTRLGASPSTVTDSTLRMASSSPAARSGHAMTLLPPTSSVLLFGGADGKIFFEDIFLLEPTRYEGSSNRSRRVSTRSSSRGGGGDEDGNMQWKRLVVSRGTTFRSQSTRSSMYSGATGTSTSSGAFTSETETCVPTFLHSGGGRDYHSMHYVQSSVEEEKARGMRVLVVGNVVVASDEATDEGEYGTRTDRGADTNAAMTFDALTLRVEELRVRQPMLEAQWEVRRVDDASMWKPRARHAHSSVVVGGDQVFVFGGKDATSSSFYNDIFYYDASLNQWVKPTVSPTGHLPQPRAFAGLTASDDGNTLFLFGGTDGKQEFGSLFLYDMVHSRWDSLAGATLGDRPSCRINHSLTFVPPNHLVLFGGRRRAVRENELFIYDASTRAWRLVYGSQSEDAKAGHRKSGHALPNDMAPVGRTAHAAVLFRADPAGPNAVQKLLIFGGYAGSHQWLDDLYLLSLPQAVLMHPPPSTRSSSRSMLATQRAQPMRVSRNKAGATARVALSAPQQLVQTRQSSQSTRLERESTQSAGLPQESVASIEKSAQLSQSVGSSQQQQQQAPPLPVDSKDSHSEQPHLTPQNFDAQVALASSPRRQTSSNEPSQPDAVERVTSTTTAATTGTATGSGVLSDITNHAESSLPKRQQQPVAPRISGVSSQKIDDGSSGTVKKHKRRRFGEGSQDSNNSNSNSSNGSGDPATAQVGIQTTLLQLLQRQPRVEDTLARILSMLTREQSARQKQRMSLETLMRIHSEEQSKHVEAVTRRNEALEGRLARAEAARASLHEKLMARETELYTHKHGLEAAIPPLNERVQAIETSHMQYLNVSRVIESKISAIHDFMDELRNAEGEGTEVDNSPQRRLGRLDDSVTTQPTPSPPKPLLYPQRVVLALEEKIRVMQSEKEALEVQLKEMAEKLKRVEEREAQARQFLFSWCQGDNPSVAAIPTNAATIAPAASQLTAGESVNTCTDKATNTVDS